MQEIKHPKGKIYYTMGEVAEMFDVNPSLLRYWEQEFDILKPKRNKKGNRLYTPKDVDNIKIIYHLLKERKMKIEVARKYIKDYSNDIDREVEITERLLNIKAMLLEIKQDLMYDGRVVDDMPGVCMEEESVEKVTVATAKAKEDPEDVSVEKISVREEEDETVLPEKVIRPPFEEQVLFDVAVPLELLQKAQENPGEADREDGYELARAAFAGELTPEPEGIEHDKETPKQQVIEQTLF